MSSGTRPLSSRQSRVLGALLGVHAGDSLGATFEFRSHGWIQSHHPLGLREIVGGGTFKWKPGHATDDTDMTRAILLAYRDLHRQQLSKQDDQQTTLDKNGEKTSTTTPPTAADVVTLAADHFLTWFNGAPWPDRRPNSRPRDIGGATHTGLEQYAESGDPAASGAGPGSAGNGSLMRCIPTALFEADPDRRTSDSMRISAVTHDDPRCTVACAAYNAMVAELVAGTSPSDAVAAGERLAYSIQSSSTSSPELASGAADVLFFIERGRTLSLPEMVKAGPPSDVAGQFSGYVLESLLLAVVAVLDEREFEDVLVDVVRMGNDTDTNGAVAGGLLGARDGVEKIPEQWREILQFGPEFREIALELAPE